MTMNLRVHASNALKFFIRHNTLWSNGTETGQASSLLYTLDTALHYLCDF
jgi:hypothetical protein